MSCLRCVSLFLALSSVYNVNHVHAQLDPLASVDWKTGNAVVDGIVEQLTPDEKLSLVHGSDDTEGYQYQAGYVLPVPRLGIPSVRLSDGEAGINTVDDATAIPVQLNVAATWNRTVAYQAGLVTGKEAKLLGLNVALAPRVNILRDPVSGNFWQSYSEDPFLNAVLGISAVHGIQDQGTMANPKQIGPSSTGASAGDTNSIVDMQTLQEVYWSAPGALLEAGAATLMCSYAQVNGVPACQYQPLFDTVRDLYNSNAIVMSDWTATHSTAPSIMAGLDWEMPLAVYYGSPLNESIYVAKNLSETYLNRAVGRILSKYQEFGLIGAAALEEAPLPDDVKLSDGEIAYDIAVKSGILLKNDNEALPIGSNKSFAVIGPNGLQYSHGTNFAERAYGFPDRQVSPIQAIQNRTGKEIPAAVGVDQEGVLVPSSALRSLDGSQGLSRNDSSGVTVLDESLNFVGDSALPANRTYEWQGSIYASTTGMYTISLQREIPSAVGKTNPDYGATFAIGTLSVNGSEAAAGYRLYGDGGIHPWSNSIATRDGWDNIKATVHLEAGWHDFSATIIGLLQQPVSVRLCWVTPEAREANLNAAVAIAQTADTAVVFAFANSPAEIALTLDDGLDELITRVAAANPNTIVVLNNAEPVLMPWLDSVSAVLQMGFAGQEGGWATADLLLGNTSPQGRLPVTYPRSLNETVTRNPAYPGRVATADGNATFSEGVNTSYRWYRQTNTSVLFPFGFGLTYTTFDYDDSQVVNMQEQANSGDELVASDTTNPLVQVSFTVKNSGQQAGNDVPQVYIGPPANAESVYPGVQFASIALVGFDNIALGAGQASDVQVNITKRQLSYFDVTSGSFKIATGKRPVWVGKNAEELVLSGSVMVG